MLAAAVTGPDEDATRTIGEDDSVDGATGSAVAEDVGGVRNHRKACLFIRIVGDEESIPDETRSCRR